MGNVDLAHLHLDLCGCQYHSTQAYVLILISGSCDYGGSYSRGWGGVEGADGIKVKLT